MGGAFFLSALKGVRPEVSGLSVHPFLVVVPLAGLYLAARRAAPRAAGSTSRAGLLLLAAVVVTEMISWTDGSAQVLAKWAVAAFTLVLFRVLTRTEVDYHWGALGVVLGVTAMALRGLAAFDPETQYYVNAMAGVGSRNVFSMWVVGPLSFCLSWLAKDSGAVRWQRVAAIASLAVLAVTQTMSLNRSGWVVMAMGIALTVASRRSVGTLVGAFAVLLLTQYFVGEFGSGEAVQYRFGELRTGTASDEFRRELAVAGFGLFLESPLIGVGQADLPRQLGWKLHELDPYSSHNLPVELLAGGGLLLVIAFASWVKAQVEVHSLARRTGVLDRRATPLLIILLLAGVRSLTGNEIVFNPALAASIGLCLGRIDCALADAGGRPRGGTRLATTGRSITLPFERSSAPLRVR